MLQSFPGSNSTSGFLVTGTNLGLLTWWPQPDVPGASASTVTYSTWAPDANHPQ
jgi:hypothetical protein